MRLSPSERKRQQALDHERAERDAWILAETAREKIEDAEKAQRVKEKAQREAEDAQRAAQALRRAAAAAEENARRARQVGPLVGRVQLLERLLGRPETPTDELFGLPDEELARREETLLSLLGSKKEANGSPPSDRP